MPATREQMQSFKDATADVFGAIQRELLIQPICAAAQAAHESNFGISQLAVEGKNIFSITPGDAWLSYMRHDSTAQAVPTWSILGIETVHYPATEYSNFPPEKIRYFEFPGDIREKKPDGKGGSILTVDRHFRRYASWEESAWDWARKISKSARYVATYQAAKAGRILEFAQDVAAAGYATENPRDYADRILSCSKILVSIP